MRTKLLGVVVALAYLGEIISSPASANTIVVDFTVAGGTWGGTIGASTGPYGLSKTPSLNGEVIIDTTKTGRAAFIGLDWVTGTRVWTLADIAPDGALGAQPTVQYSNGIFLNFYLLFTDQGSGNYIGSGDWGGLAGDASIDDPVSGLGIDCNACSSIIGVREISATPLPAALPLFATGLGALGLLGWRRKRKAAA